MESVECASDHPSMEITMAAVSLEIVEESPTGQHLLQQDVLSETKSEEFVRIDMPSNLIPTFKKMNLCGFTSELYEEGSSVGLSLTPNSEHQTGVLSMEEVAVLALGNSQLPPLDKSPVLMPALPIHRAISMPAIPTRPFNLSSTDDSYIALNTNGVGEQPIYRSRSVPVSYSDSIMREEEDHVKVLRVVPNRRMSERNTALLSAAVHNGEVDEDDITEEEAVCRICLGELGEEAFKLECDCKGELALVHKQCIQRWFNLRGTRTCEICRKKVRNVTVKVKRMRSVNFNFLRETPVTYAEMIWNEALLLYVISWIAYMLFIKVLQKFRRSGDHIDEPYGGFPTSTVLAILTVAASVFGKWKHIWIYAVAQFVVFIVFALIFFNLLYLSPVWTLILATIFALGISRGGGPAYLAFKKWREGQRNELNNNHHDAEVPTEVDSTQETAESHYSDADSHESNEDTSETESHYSDANIHD